MTKLSTLCTWIWNLRISHSKTLWAGFSKKYGDKYCRNFEICLSSFSFTSFVCNDLSKDIELSPKSDFSNILKAGSITFNSSKPFKPIENTVSLSMSAASFESNSRDDFLLALAVAVEGKLPGICSCCSCFARDVILVFHVPEIKSVEKTTTVKRPGYKAWRFYVRVEREGGRCHSINIVKSDWLISVNSVQSR